MICARKMRRCNRLRKAIDDVLRSGLYVGGPQTDALELELAAYLGVPHVVAVNSGTDALFLTLRAAGIGAGDEVIVPSYTFIASATAVSMTGAVPVFVDSLRDRFTIDPKAASAAVTARTRALIAVHLFGEPAELDEPARAVRSRWNTADRRCRAGVRRALPRCCPRLVRRRRRVQFLSDEKPRMRGRRRRYCRARCSLCRNAAIAARSRAQRSGIRTSAWA